MQKFSESPATWVQSPFSATQGKPAAVSQGGREAPSNPNPWGDFCPLPDHLHGRLTPPGPAFSQEASRPYLPVLSLLGASPVLGVAQTVDGPTPGPVVSRTPADQQVVTV